MKPVKFKHQNVVFAKDKSKYEPLPALILKDDVISCWKLSFKERIKVFFTGRVWMALLTFGEPPMPSSLAVNRKEMYLHPDDEKTILSRVKKFLKLKFLFSSKERGYKIRK